jgi:hypothetical protein
MAINSNTLGGGLLLMLNFGIPIGEVMWSQDVATAREQSTSCANGNVRDREDKLYQQQTTLCSSV